MGALLAKSSNSAAWLWSRRSDIGVVILGLIAGTALVSAIILAFYGMAASGSLCAVLGLLLLAFVRLSKFRKFRGLGFEAELWEDKQAEAERLIERTRALLVLLTKTMVTAAPRMNRMMEAFSKREQLALAQRAEEELLAAGVAPADLQGLYSEVDKWTAWDMASPVCRDISQAINRHVAELESRINEQFGSPIKDSVGYSAARETLVPIRSSAFDPNDLDAVPLTDWPDEIKRRVGAVPSLPTDTKTELMERHREALLDLEAWVKGRQVRRPEHFGKRAEE